MRPCLSLVYLTYRPGGIDLLVESLRYQEPIYELIIIDDYPGRVERGEATNYIKRSGLPLTYHGPSKPHSYPDHCNGLANAMNTGALHATTLYIVFVHDFVWFPPGAMWQWSYWISHYSPNTILSGVAVMHPAKKPEKQGDVSIWHTDTAFCARNLFQRMESWTPRLFENFYAGVPLEFIQHINGFDERADCGHISWPCFSMFHQAYRNSVQAVVNPELLIHMVNHRVWKKLDAKLWHAENMSIRKKIPNWQPVSPNPYNFRQSYDQIVDPQREPPSSPVKQFVDGIPKEIVVKKN